MRQWHHQLTHLHIHIHICSRNVLLRNDENSNFLSLSLLFHADLTLIKFPLFCAKLLYSFFWINLNLDRSSPLSGSIYISEEQSFVLFSLVIHLCDNAVKAFFYFLFFRNHLKPSWFCALFWILFSCLSGLYVWNGINSILNMKLSSAVQWCLICMKCGSTYSLLASILMQWHGRIATEDYLLLVGGRGGGLTPPPPPVTITKFTLELSGMMILLYWIRFCFFNSIS